jgi:hypothetical protein
MKFWWVNLGDSFEEAREMGALWAPLMDKSGQKRQDWESLDRVKIGDLIFLYSKKRIRGVSTATTESRRAEIRLRDRGQWETQGREIEVLIQDFDFTIDLDEIPLSLRENSIGRISTPFDRRGKVKQGYLYGLPQPVVNFVLNKLNLVDEQNSQPMGEQLHAILGDFSMGTDKRITGSFRREQRALRHSLLGRNSFVSCGICNRRLSSNLLVAAHIKPRNSCSEKERVDPNVVMLACVLGCDALFDKGVIYLDEKGTVRLSGRFSEEQDLKSFVSHLEGKTATAFSFSSRKYFDWHAKNVATRH